MESEPIRDVDWQRFDGYARRVRTLKFWDADIGVIDISLYLRVALLGRAPLLPSLHTLMSDFPGFPPSPITKFLPYLGSSVQSVYMHIASADLKDLTVFRALAENAKVLQKLSLQGDVSAECLRALAACSKATG